MNLNLEQISEKMENFSFEVLAFTGSMLSVKKDCKINIYHSGKMAVMTKDLNRVQKIAEELENILHEKKL
jgi:TATA-box binding protein (TBP) (component of TFIID and TFIIIB)